MSAAPSVVATLDRIQRRAGLVGLGASALLLVGLLTDRDQFFQSYLMAFLLWLGVGLGSLGFVLLHKLTGGAWGFAARRLLEASIRTLPFLALLFVPVALGMGHLFEWTHAEEVAADPLLQHKSPYLNTPFFLVRAAACFALWILYSRWILRLSEQHDRSADPRVLQRLRNLAGPGLILYVGAMSFAAVDWAMSLEPHWFSTIYGAQLVVGQGLSTLCFAVVAARVLARHEPFSRFLAPAHFHDLGNLTMAFVLLWAYTSFSQFLIIWSGNLPEETPWYLHRAHGGWQVESMLLMLFHFAVPFALLLSRRNKRALHVLSRVALGLLFFRLVEMHWLVAPAFHQHGFHLSWMDLVAPVALGGLWLHVYVRMLRGRPLIALHDARLHERLEEASPA